MTLRQPAKTRAELNEISGAIIGAAIEVHRHLGPGLLESVYEEALAYELDLRKIPYERQVEIPIYYKGARLKRRLRVDYMVVESVLVDLKAVSSLQPIDDAQMISYLKLTGLKLGLLLNFNVVRLKDGIRRLVM